MRHKDGKIHREGSKKHAENVVANSTRATSVSNIRQVDRYKYTFCVAVHNYWCCCCWRLLAVHRSSSNVRQKSMERSIPFKMLYGTNLIMEWLNLLYDASMLSGPKLMLNEKNDCSIAFFQICEKKMAGSASRRLYERIQILSFTCIRLMANGYSKKEVVGFYRTGGIFCQRMRFPTTYTLPSRNLEFANQTNSVPAIMANGNGKTIIVAP